MEKMQAMQNFKVIFGEAAEELFTAAGRINVIGEHIDYCGGKVFPAALNLRCCVYAKKREGNTIRMAFRGIDGIVELDTNKLDSYKNLKIGNYQAGVAYFLHAAQAAFGQQSHGLGSVGQGTEDDIRLGQERVQILQGVDLIEMGSCFAAAVDADRIRAKGLELLGDGAAHIACT